MHRNRLLTIDGSINIMLGILLMTFPQRWVTLLGVPTAVNGFYPNILGGVLFGIGLALIIERFNKTDKRIGLGLGGAVIINLCGGAVLAAWLLFGNLALPPRGRVFLWLIACLLFGISAIELTSTLFSRHRDA